MNYLILCHKLLDGSQLCGLPLFGPPVEALHIFLRGKILPNFHAKPRHDLKTPNMYNIIKVKLIAIITTTNSKIKVWNKDTYHMGKGEHVQCVCCFLPFSLELLLVIGIFRHEVLRLLLLKSSWINDRPPMVGVECVSVIQYGHVLLAHRLIRV